MFKALLPALAIFALAWSALADTPAKPAKPQKRRHTATTGSKHARKHAVVATKAAPAKTTKAQAVTVANTTAHRKGKSTRRPSRSYQQAPSPERYKEIQQALASKGYLAGEPSGSWGPDSVDALKRFQTDQNLMPDGKITSLSLIALGLGPKRLTAKSDPAPPQPGTPTPAPSAPPQ